MKKKIGLTWRIGLALVLALSLSLVMALPVAATHTSSATVAFHAGASQLVGETSVLDVVVTNEAGSLGIINEVKIDFSATEFTSVGKGTEPTNWTGVVADSVITYTAAAGAEILTDTSLTFFPTVTNPEEPGLVTPNPTVTTSDLGNKATITVDTDIVVTAAAPGAAGNDISIAVTVVEVATDNDAATIDVSLSGTDITVAVTNDSGAINPETVTRKAVADALNMSTSGTLFGEEYTGSEGGNNEVDVTITNDVTGLVVGSGGFDADAGAVTKTSLADGEPQEQSALASGALTIKEFAVAAVPGAFTSATATDYTITFTTLTEIVATTGTITITFPSGYDITDLLKGDIDMTVAGSAYVPSDTAIDAVAGTVTITADTAIAADKVVVVTTDKLSNLHVKNPPTSGTYNIAVLTSGPDEGSGEVTIIPAAFSVVAGTNDTVTAGTAFAVTISALNADDGSDTGYAGSYFIDFTLTGTGTAPTFELISFTAGVGTSPENFILTVAGEATVTIDATDAETGITGTSAAITINPAGLASFTISGEPGSVTAGEDFDTADITVTAYDAEAGGGNVKTDYVGTVTWTSTDELAELPADYTFTAEDEGVHVFPGSEFILKTVGGGTQTITVTDEVADVEKDSGSITVVAAAATELTVAADAAVIRVNDTDPSTITATAVDEFGNKDTSYVAAVTFETSLGTLSAVDANFTGGEASATLKSSEVGTAIIKVTSGAFDPVTTTVKLLPLIGISSIDATVDKSTILNNDVDVRTITATYLDSGSAVVTAADGADYTVTFTHDGADEVTLDPADGVVVPVDGVATVTLTTTLATGTIIVTATGTGVTDTSPGITVEEGTSEITLSQGWNLISLPLIPVDESIETVLAGLITEDTVIQVRAYNASDGTWSIWASTGPYALYPTLTEMDDGLGFWIEMSDGDVLTAIGCVLPAPPETPPTYSIYTGWNLIGFTSLTNSASLVAYLGTLVDGTREAIYVYTASTGIYEIPTFFEAGYGYWLAVNNDGTIYP